jgi:GNAT superfamily N-acetyltransferase
VIREADSADLDEVILLVGELAAYEQSAHEVELERESFGRHVFGPESSVRVLLAEEDGSVLGFALYFPTFSTWLGRPGIWLEELFVRPHARGRGIGRALLAAVAGRTEGRVEWAVLDWNEPAHGFYRRFGAAPLDDWTTWRLPPSDRR